MRGDDAPTSRARGGQGEQEAAAAQGARQGRAAAEGGQGQRQGEGEGQGPAQGRPFLLPARALQGAAVRPVQDGEQQVPVPQLPALL